MKQEWFSSWFNSPYYHILYKNRTDDEANAFIDKLIDYLKLPKESKILDVACGKGRHSLSLAKYGYEVTGIDLSSNSIGIAQSREIANTSFFVHDMRNPFYYHYFDMVCNFFTSFGYFEHEHENNMAAQHMIAALKKDGLFLIDFVNATFAKKNIDAHQQEEVILDDISFTIHRFYTNYHLVKKISFTNAAQMNEQHEERVQIFSAEALKTIFEKQGCMLLQSFGNYNLDAFEENNSPRIILLFKKQ